MSTQTPTLGAALAAACAVTAPAIAGTIDVSYDAPILDRWMYPFNATPGTRFFSMPKSRQR